MLPLPKIRVHQSEPRKGVVRLEMRYVYYEKNENNSLIPEESCVVGSALNTIFKELNRHKPDKKQIKSKEVDEENEEEDYLENIQLQEQIELLQNQLEKSETERLYLERKLCSKVGRKP